MKMYNLFFVILLYNDTINSSEFRQLATFKRVSFFYILMLGDTALFRNYLLIMFRFMV